MDVMNSLSNRESNLAYKLKLQKFWLWLLLLGLVHISLGVVAIFNSTTATYVSLFFIGIYVLINGVGYAAYAFSFWWQNWRRCFQYLLLGVLYIVTGGIMMSDPVNSAISVTLFLAIFFMVVGLWRALTAYRFELPLFTWETLSGLMTLLLGILIWQQWPSASMWVLGVFVGIDMILVGLYFTVLSLFTKSLFSNTP